MLKYQYIDLFIFSIFKHVFILVWYLIVWQIEIKETLKNTFKIHPIRSRFLVLKNCLGNNNVLEPNRDPTRSQ